MAVYVVTAYANRIYRKAVEAAEKRHAESKETIYVANGAIEVSSLRTYNRNEFRGAKRLLGLSGSKHYNIAAIVVLLP